MLKIVLIVTDDVGVDFDKIAYIDLERVEHVDCR